MTATAITCLHYRMGSGTSLRFTVATDTNYDRAAGKSCRLAEVARGEGSSSRQCSNGRRTELARVRVSKCASRRRRARRTSRPDMDQLLIAKLVLPVAYVFAAALFTIAGYYLALKTQVGASPKELYRPYSRLGVARAIFRHSLFVFRFTGGGNVCVFETTVSVCKSTSSIETILELYFYFAF